MTVKEGTQSAVRERIQRIKLLRYSNDSCLNNVRLVRANEIMIYVSLREILFEEDECNMSSPGTPEEHLAGRCDMW